MGIDNSQSPSNFDINTAVELAYLSDAVYSEDQTRDPVSFSATLKGRGFTLISNVPVSSTGTQCFIAKNDHFGILVFAGTAFGSGDQTLCDFFSDASGRLKNGYHEGFYAAFESVASKIRSALDTLSGLPLYATGHSLGGALANLAVLSLPQYNWRACYTFGSPPVCDASTGAQNKVPTYRIVNKGDLVSRILDLKEVPQLESVFETLENIIDGVTAKLGKGRDLYEYFKAMRPDIKMYCHFGQVILFDDNGYILTNVSSGDAFRQAFQQNPFQMIEDHRMLKYINNLEKHRSMNIMRPAKEDALEQDRG